MNKETGGRTMVVLGIIVALLGGYLVYALVHPEKF
ncbi:MAG: K(+)-transporting ATPase subunit F [Butyricicoccus pullicaecorum]